MSAKIEQSHTQPPGVPPPLPSSLEYSKPYIQRGATTIDQDIESSTAVSPVTFPDHITKDGEQSHIQPRGVPLPLPEQYHTQPDGAPLPLLSSLEEGIHFSSAVTQSPAVAISATNVFEPVQRHSGPQPDICVVMPPRAPLSDLANNVSGIRFGVFPVSKVGGIEKIVKQEKFMTMETIVEEEDTLNPGWAQVVEKKPGEGEMSQPQKGAWRRLRGNLGGSLAKNDEKKTRSGVKPGKRDLADTVRAWRDNVNKEWNSEGFEWTG